MAAVAPPADQASDLLQKLSLDSQPKALEIPEPTKKTSVDSGDTNNGQIQPFDRSITPLLQEYVDPVAFYPNTYAASTAYYYSAPGYDGTTNDWEEYSRYLNPDGVDLSHGVYGENGSLMYPGYGYAPYGPYSPAGSPVPTVGHDGQLYGAQHYQYPSPYFQPMTPSSGPYSTPSVPPKGEISTSAAAEQAPLSVDTANGNSNSIVNGTGVKGGNGPVRSATYQNSAFNANGSYGRGAQNAYQDPRFGFDGVRSPIPWLDGSMYSDGQARPIPSVPINSSVSNGNGMASRNQNVRPHSHFMGLQTARPMPGMNTASGYMGRMYPSKVLGYGSTYRSGFGYGSNAYDSRNNGRGWLAVDSKYKPRGRGNGFFGYNNENGDGLNELNRGPRAKSTKNQKVLTPVALAVKGQNIPLTAADEVEKEEKGKEEKLSLTPDRVQYNRPDFPETYVDAKFFIIKSYSEDDVHKSIKYNVWASTQNGNKKLDAAYQEAKQKTGECPVFLFFSVNTSGQFVGVAEMVGPVDFNKSVEYWQQDKWIGCFPVKWHIVKDVPNSLLKHITLENNENKPVTNSRDTQEVKLEQGLLMIKIFKEYIYKQCILDDFDFYEERQKRIQEKKAKQQQFQKQVWEGKTANDEKSKEGVKVEVLPAKLNDTAPDLVKEAIPAVQTNGEAKPTENGSVLKSEDLPKSAAKTVGDVAKPTVVPEKTVVANGVANGC